MRASAAHRDEPWARRAPARAVRGAALRGIFAPLVAGYARVRVSGREPLTQLPGPVVLVANHASHVDTPILLNALPGRLRRRTLVGAAADYFYTRRTLAVAVALTFGTVPIHRRRDLAPPDDMAALGALLADGFSLVLFAEGTRSRTGRLGEFRPGAAVLAARAGVPLVPVHLGGTRELMGPGRGWMARADRAVADPDAHGDAGTGVRAVFARRTVTVDFGAPLYPERAGEAPETMDEVRRFMDHFQEGPVAVHHGG